MLMDGNIQRRKMFIFNYLPEDGLKIIQKREHNRRLQKVAAYNHPFVDMLVPNRSGE